jgi:hypothetical protein
MSLLINALGFQLAWWALVAGVAPGLEAAALALCAVLAAAHVRYMSASPRREAALAIAALLVGICVDTVLQATGFITFHGASLGPLSPFWLWMLWALFGLTLDASMAFLKRRHWALSALLGGVFGPLSYLAGAKMGAADLAATPLNFAVLAGAWVIALPLLVGLARRAERVASQTA